MKLTIAIPTYNRGEYILDSLNSILEQKNDDVEVLICDNASTDNTQEVLSSYIENGSVMYYRSEMNGGMDYNFLNCLKFSKGDFVLLFSDDDILLPGAINHILNLIEKENPDYINLNSAIFLESLDDMEPNGRLKVKDNTDFITYDKNDFMECIDFSITYLSATLIKRSLFLEVKNPERYYGTFFLHAHVALETMKGNKKLIVTKEPFVASRIGNSGGFNLYKVWVYQYKRLLLGTAVKNGCSKSVMKRIYIDNINGFIKNSIYSYRMQESGYEINKRWLLFRCTYLYPSVWIKTYPYAYLPKSLLMKLSNLKQRFRKSR